MMQSKISRDITDRSLYDLALYSYYIALLHFGSEVLIYKTARWGAIGPGVVACKRGESEANGSD